jgi:isoleucyl-tRNA synthetase
LNVKEEKANEFMIKLLKEENALFYSFKYQRIEYKHNKTKEKIIMRTTDSWYMKISDQLKMKCLRELATIKYVPALNLKTD